MGAGTVNDDILNEKLRDLRRLKRAADELHDGITALEDEIKAELTRREVDEITTKDYRVSWKSVVSTRLDTKALKEERPEIYERYAKDSVSKRFVVT